MNNGDGDQALMKLRAQAMRLLEDWRRGEPRARTKLERRLVEENDDLKREISALKAVNATLRQRLEEERRRRL